MSKYTLLARNLENIIALTIYCLELVKSIYTA